MVNIIIKPVKTQSGKNWCGSNPPFLLLSYYIHQMDYAYLLINGYDWEDMVIIVTEEQAIQASIKYPNSRVEIFSKNTEFGYSPTYKYYKNGELYKNFI